MSLASKKCFLCLPHTISFTRSKTCPPPGSLRVLHEVPDVEFTHEGPLCSFDAFIKKYQLND
ncbi:MAG: chromate resistance protein ChrB domain-containing protein [Pseudobdellovibrionaceae bacterium]